MEGDNTWEEIAAERAAFLEELRHIEAAVSVCDDKGFILQTIRRAMRLYDVEAE